MILGLMRADTMTASRQESHRSPLRRKTRTARPLKPLAIEEREQMLHQVSHHAAASPKKRGSSEQIVSVLSGFRSFVVEPPPHELREGNHAIGVGVDCGEVER
jgi:hypothetical protein